MSKLDETRGKILDAICERLDEPSIFDVEDVASSIRDLAEAYSLLRGDVDWPVIVSHQAKRAKGLDDISKGLDDPT